MDNPLRFIIYVTLNCLFSYSKVCEPKVAESRQVAVIINMSMSIGMIMIMSTSSSGRSVLAHQIQTENLSMPWRRTLENSRITAAKNDGLGYINGDPVWALTRPAHVRAVHHYRRSDDGSLQELACSTPLRYSFRLTPLAVMRSKHLLPIDSVPPQPISYERRLLLSRCHHLASSIYCWDPSMESWLQGRSSPESQLQYPKFLLFILSWRGASSVVYKVSTDRPLQLKNE
jgi:hypothetical protein